MIRQKKSAVLFGIFLLIVSVVPMIVLGQDEEYEPVDVPNNYTAALNTVYSTVGDWQGKMDIYYPTASANPVPVVINVHGGAWTHGTKESQRGFGSFFKHGWTVVNVEYRMSPIAPAPAAIEDIRCALFYIVNHSTEFKINAEQIVLMGGSAGGHLVLMAGLLGNDKKFDAGCAVSTRYSIAAIVDKYGVSYMSGLTALLKSRSTKAWLKENIDNPEFLRSISPIYYVSKDSPPMFIVHGNADPTVPYQQSVDLHQRLDSLGVVNEFVTVEGGGHGKFSKEKNSEISKAMWAFFTTIGLSEGKPKK